MGERYALFSVTDRTGIGAFARGLVELGWRIIATRGTARALADEGIPVIPLEEWTGFPEILGGRVKTLHPKVHAGILARPTEADLAEVAAIGGRPIDLVAVNLYAFEEAIRRGSIEAAVEAIDIGGVALLRAAAKNFARVIVCSSPEDYPVVLEALRQTGEVPLALRRRLAAQAFRRTAGYDALIARYLEGGVASPEALPDPLLLFARPLLPLRYGENPHQAGAFYGDPLRPLPFETLQGKPLSYNNLLDMEAAWRAVRDLPAPACVIVKHNNPCGAAIAETPAEAFRRALAGDSESAYGGIVAFNAEVDGETAEALRELFVEVIIAPAYRPEAMGPLGRKKACRVIRITEAADSDLEIRSALGGLLVQTPDRMDDPTAWKVVTRRHPTASEWEDLRFAWRVVRHVRSNAIVLAREGQTVGIGAGQMSRVDAVRVAVMKAGERARGAVLASDAFFPFPDGVEVAAAAGVTAIIQPGGSIRDAAVIEAADREGMAMVFTGVRHFRH